MTDENPYRYEGTAESLDERPLPPTKRGNTLLSAILAGIAAAFTGSVAASFIDAEVIGLALILTLFVFFPISIYCWKHVAKGEQKTSQFYFWIAAIPLQCFFGLMMVQQGEGEAGIAREIGFLLTINYLLQLLAASLTLLAVIES